MGVVHLDKYNSQQSKLKRILEKINFLIKNHTPDALAIEAPFYGKNVQSMLKLGRAQGVAMIAAISKDIPIYEYAPKKIKQAVTGNGNASKEQVAAMLKQLLRFQESSKYLDATDALAAAVCHHFQSNTLGDNDKGYKNWKAFVKANPERLK